MASSLLGEKNQLLGIWLAIWQLWKLRKNHKEPQEVEVLKRNLPETKVAVVLCTSGQKQCEQSRVCTSSMYFINLHRSSSIFIP